MTKSVLFLVRDKLGDSLLAVAVALAYARNNPEVHVTVMVREDYAPLFAAVDEVELVFYKSALQAQAWALWARLTRPAFDAFAVLRGFGPRVKRLGRLVRARRKIYMNGRFAEVFPEFPQVDFHDSENAPIIDASWRVAQVLDSNLKKPERLLFPGLQAMRREAGQDEFVGICPLTDEARKDLSRQAVLALVDRIKADHPGIPVKILVRNFGDKGFVQGEIGGAEVVAFQDIPGLLACFSAMRAYYGADTGLYHVAAAMGIPCHVLFGPTQPYKILLPGQNAWGWRVAGLGERHCAEKQCRTPLCIDRAAANLAGTRDVAAAVGEMPAACPLLALPADEQACNSVYRHGACHHAE
ncbi:hypothetical protein OTERR_28730 [Oryzomicrobium terrae]|uniref:Uncharacterized protein n=1 Tax=Oryzomicrobium terrae TaxID=1735038 RepID=A0A5C1ECK5_9RHOO|nr:glycosyltransferase family 9 protein [Oryzomicrobium terrae]QEL66349.1 hypothetical protein OTERR_28730 [Oryzomicrobium terrae]